MQRVIDLNCDLGEGCGDDGAIVPLLSSASIACGGHAGDETSMRETLRLCARHGVSAGAHPGFLDRDGFGRREQALTMPEIHALVTSQLQRLTAIAREEGVVLRHVKPHGALYNQAARDRRIAGAVAAAVAAFDPALVLFGLSGSELVAAGRAAGLRVAHEVFAERGYGSDGQLLPRGRPGAVLDLDAAVEQVRAMLAGEAGLPSRADTICLHGDRPDAATLARALRAALEADGIRIASLTRTASHRSPQPGRG